MPSPQQIIGDIGEALVQEFHGKDFVLSENRYDSNKDGTFRGMTAEIKTMTRVIKDNEYWLETDQYRKVTTVDLLFIVDIPLHAEQGAKIYLCPNNKRLQTEYRLKFGKSEQMVIIPADSLYELTVIKNDDRVIEMVKLSDNMSKFRRDLKSRSKR